MEAAQFAEYLLQTENLLIVGAVWTIIKTIKQMFPKLAKNKVYGRLLPLIPILLCSAAVWIPGAASEDLTVGSRIFLGVILGAMAGQAHKILRQTALGKDDRIKPKT